MYIHLFLFFKSKLLIKVIYLSILTIMKILILDKQFGEQIYESYTYKYTTGTLKFKNVEYPCSWYVIASKPNGKALRLFERKDVVPMYFHRNGKLYSTLSDKLFNKLWFAYKVWTRFTSRWWYMYKKVSKNDDLYSKFA